ncbi:hypothetical protein G6F56_014276 [Rhizopus delemar]|nr:hypothetical protein G6F58_013567 [Rhizopus delemar]KAG1434537.1 hypothetical protein G6F56_014276 [Rhizopus delemar]
MWWKRCSGAQAITRPSTPGRMSTLECCNSSWMAMANASTDATGIGRPSTSSGSTPPTASAAWCSGCFIRPLKPYMRVTL